MLAVGHSGGVSTMLVPGAGEPNYDSRVADPFQGRAARREAEVHALLDKLQPDMIRLDPATIAQVLIDIVYRLVLFGQDIHLHICISFLKITNTKYYRTVSLSSIDLRRMLL